MTPHLTIQMQERIQNGRQATRSDLVALGQRGDETISTSLHQSPHDLPQLRPARVDAIQLGQRLGSPTRQYVIQQGIEQPRIRDAQQRPSRLQTDRARRQRHQLVQQPHRIAHRPLRGSRDQRHRFRIDRNLLRLGDVRQPRHDLLLTVPPEHELLTPPDNRQRDLLCVGRAQDEHNVRRRLLQRL